MVGWFLLRLGMLAETSGETRAEEEDLVKGAEGSACAEDESSSQLVEENEVKEEEDGSPADVCCNELAMGSPTLVNILDYVPLKHYEESSISPWLF